MTEDLEIFDEDDSLPDEFFLDLLEQVKLGSLAAKMGGGDARKGLRKVFILQCVLIHIGNRVCVHTMSY